MKEDTYEDFAWAFIFVLILCLSVWRYEAEIWAYMERIITITENFHGGSKEMKPATFELATIEKLDAVQVFTGGGVDPILKAISEEVRLHEPDTSTDKGRKDIASLAYKVSQSKVLLEKAGKSLVTGWKEQAKAVDEVRKMVRDSLDELRDEARQPLTDWETAEKERDAACLLMMEIAQAHIDALVHNDIVDREADLAAKELAMELAEEQRIAKEAFASSELERVAREKKIAEDAVAEEKRQAEAEKIRVAEEAQEKIDRVKREKREFEINAEIEKRESKEREDRAKIRADLEKKQVVEDERKRVAAELETNRLADEKIAANKTHQKKVNNAALAALCGIVKEAEAKKIIVAISKGEVPHITINY
jgi:hypothetical protein